MGLIYSIVIMIVAGVGAYLALTTPSLNKLVTADSWLVTTFGQKNVPMVLAGGAGVLFVIGLLWFLTSIYGLTTGYRNYQAHVQQQIATQTDGQSLGNRLMWGVGVREQPNRLKGVMYLVLTVVFIVGLVIAWDLLGDYYITLKFMDTPLMGARLFVALGALGFYIQAVGELRGKKTVEELDYPQAQSQPQTTQFDR
jgi:hypothetical protein